MLGLPPNTEIHRQLAKRTVYTKFQMNTATKARIDTDIAKMVIVHEISPQTVNIPAGEDVAILYVLKIVLKRKDYSDKTIEMLAKLIPQKLLFILEYENESRLAVYRTKLLQTDWKPTNEHLVQLIGLDLNVVWENVIMSIGNISPENNNSIDEQIVIDEKRAKIAKELARLEKNIRKERQPHRKLEIAKKIGELKKELED